MSYNVWTHRKAGRKDAACAQWKTGVGEINSYVFFSTLFYTVFIQRLNFSFISLKCSCPPMTPWLVTGDRTSQMTWYFHTTIVEQGGVCIFFRVWARLLWVHWNWDDTQVIEATVTAVQWVLSTPSRVWNKLHRWVLPALSKQASK